MKQLIFLFSLVCLTQAPLAGQTNDTIQPDESMIVDVVRLRDGSVLNGTILKWELDRGMQFKLITGVEIMIPVSMISRVYQDTPFAPKVWNDNISYNRGPKPYSFKEEGLYHTFSVFLNTSDMGGAGVHYSIGHRFSRLLSVGIGSGLESNDFYTTRKIIPLYAEARGFFVPKKITPYYALKLGYGFAMEDEIDGTTKSKGGLHFSPEFGVRFGGTDVNYYLGLEYKIQNATFENTFFWDPGTVVIEDVSYRRFELRTGLVF